LVARLSRHSRLKISYENNSYKSGGSYLSSYENKNFPFLGSLCAPSFPVSRLRIYQDPLEVEGAERALFL
jgi:hypothetical protein